MIRNYFKIALRSLQKNKLQTTINLLGLTVGTVCCLSILVYVFAQFGYDQHFKDSSSIYRINTTIKEHNEGTSSAGVSPPIAFAMKEDFPEVDEACRVVYFGAGSSELLRNPESGEFFYEKRGYLADSTFFDLFNYPLLEGKSGSALNAPNSIVLSKQLSQKLFGNQSALNKTLILGNGEQEQNLVVTGVFDEDFGKSHLNPNYILTMNSGGLGQQVLNMQNFATENFALSYVKLNDGSNPKTLEAKLPDFLEKHGAKDFAQVGFHKSLSLQTISDIHLYSKNISNQIDRVSDINYLYVLMVLALFIQLVACVNFINLSTARANKRAREIGVRKAIGADKLTLVKQFLGESIFLSMIASILSIPFTALVLPYLNSLTLGSIKYSALLDWRILVALLVLGLLTGLLAGLYPALILSDIKPVKVLKTSAGIDLGSGTLRKALVVFQFVISISLICSVIIISQQVKYSQKMDMGFDKENLIAIRLGTESVSGRFEAIENKFQSMTEIAEVAGANFYPTEFVMGDMGLIIPGQSLSNRQLVHYNGISPNYLKTVKTPLLVGRYLKTTDENQVLVNKTTLDAFGIPLDQAVGSRLADTNGDDSYIFEIVGVTDDFNFGSLKQEIAPILLYNETQPDWILLRTETRNFEPLLAQLEAAWKTINPEAPFVFNFVDQEAEKLFAEEKRLSRISMVFTSLAIFISCLGLFGLVSFVAEQKKKEIGIRKVLGASVENVVRLLTKDFVILVGVAFIIASPLVYFLMQNWLEDFPYRISIQWWVFVIAGGGALIITLLTVSFQSFKAAVQNPIKSLRTE
jgi:predicted permease